MDTLALLYGNFEQACAQGKEAEEEFDKYLDEMFKRLSSSREKCAEAAAIYERAEIALNEGLGLSVISGRTR